MHAIPENWQVQRIAKEVLGEIAESIGPGSTERSIASDAVALLERYGVTQTWYYNCNALVLLGSRSCLSVSGRDYALSTEFVGQTNLVTIDLSPLQDGHWGDCARSYVVESGRVVKQPAAAEFQRGIALVSRLHAEIKQFANPGTRFCDLHQFANGLIVDEDLKTLIFWQRWP